MSIPLTDDILTQAEPPDPASLDITGDPTPEVDDTSEPDSIGDAEDQA